MAVSIYVQSEGEKSLQPLADPVGPPCGGNRRRAMSAMVFQTWHLYYTKTSRGGARFLEASGQWLVVSGERLASRSPRRSTP